MKPTISDVELKPCKLEVYFIDGDDERMIYNERMREMDDMLHR